ncbi:MAG TPA: redoxin domain-containing protein [Haliangiales bacterium]|nr:redoxin domain-containing protein [Haliangiales bacterium]
MNDFLIFGIVLSWVFIGVGCWVGWQLLRQNGRILLRLDELEKRLDALEFGESDEPAGLPVGSAAPEFELPDLAGEQKSLAQFRDQPLLLIFFNPDCGFCRDLAPKLAARFGLRRQGERDAALANQAGTVAPIQSAVTSGAVQNDGDRSSDRVPLPLILTTCDAEKNRQFFAEHKLACPVLLQKEMEVAGAYKAYGTPTGYLIGADGRIASALAVGAEGILALATEPGGSRAEEAHASVARLSALDSQPEDQSRVIPAAASGREDSRVSRFSSGSLARSRIKRDGLKAGTPAPEFRLPRLDGRGELSLVELRGRRVLLVFSDPHCAPCSVLARELEKFHGENKTKVRPPSPRPSPPGEGELLPVEVVLISRGEPRENRAKVKEHGLTFPVVLQQRWEISRLYGMFATPMAYLVDEAGIISANVAVGVDGILALVSSPPAGQSSVVAENLVSDSTGRL